MTAIRHPLLASLAAALSFVAPAASAAGSSFITGAVSGYPTGWSTSASQLADVVTVTDDANNVHTNLAFSLGDAETITYTPVSKSDAGGTADVAIHDAVFSVAYDHPGVEAVGGLSSQAAICAAQIGDAASPSYYGWVGAYTGTAEEPVLTWFELAGAAPATDGSPVDVVLSFDYTATPATVTFKVGNATLYPATGSASAPAVELVNNTPTQVTAVSFSGEGSIGEMTGTSEPAAPSEFAVSFFESETAASALWTTNVPSGASMAVYGGTTPAKTATAEWTYTFAGWTNATVTTPSAITALPAVTAATSYYAVFTATPVSYTLTWNLDGGSITSEAGNYTAAGSVAYGTSLTAPQVDRTGYTFGGWSPSVAGTMPAADTTYTATWTINTYTITWKDGDGNTLATDTVDYNETPSYTGATPTKAATEQYTYTFNNTWSPTILAATEDATYTAQFTATPVSHTLTWNLDGGSITSEAGNYTAAGSVAYGTSLTAPQVARTGYTFGGWSPSVAGTMPAADTTYTATWTINTYTITWKDGDGNTLATDTVDYNVTPSYTGATPTKAATEQYTYTFNNTWSPTIVAATADATYTAQFEPTLLSYTVTWKNWDGTVLETDPNVDYGTTPTYDGATPTKASDASYDYSFSGWDPSVANVTGDATYTAQFTATERVIPVLALAKPTIGSTALANAQSGAVVRATIDPAATVTGASATAGVSVDVDGATATFTNLPWNEAVDWTLSATDAADLPGRFYAKGETEWFNVETNGLDDVTGLADGMKGVDKAANPSAAGQMVRIQTCLEIGEGGLEELPSGEAVGDARTGFAVAQIADNDDEAPFFYAFNGSTWDKLLGATPVANTTNDLLIVLDVAASTARYYVDGIALYKDNEGAHAYAIAMKASETAAIHGIGFANAEGVKAPVVAEYDVPFEAAVGDTPYAAAADGLAAADKTGAQTLYLLTNDVAGTIELAAGQSVKVDTAKGSFASAEPVVLAQSVGAGYEVKATGEGSVTNYTVALVEYPIVWNLDLAGATNAVANALTNSYTVADLPITLFPAGCVDYTFDGWTNNVAAGVQTTIPAGTTGAVTNWATWHRNAFTITWNVEGATTTSEVLPGVVPSFTGTPEKAADNTYTYTFAGWAESSGGSVIALPEASANATYYAVFTPVYINYTITWNYVDPATGNMTSDQTTVHWGQTPSHADPAGYVANNTIYAFDDWNVEPAAYDGTVTAYTATYTSAAAAAMVISVADAETGATTTNYVATLADAFGPNGAKDGDTVELLSNVTLTERVEPNVGANTAITIDLGGYTITREGTSGNGSAFDVKSGDVTITNGVIVCTQDDTAIAADGVYAITSRSGSNVTLADLAITVDSECGACAYPFSGSTMTIESGTYANVTTTPYRYNTAITGMAVNQPNEATQSLVIKGGSFSQYDPQLGDDSGKMTDFTDDGFVAIQDGNGNWVVQPGYNVTFDANGGSPAPAAQRVAAGGTATAPTAPTAANRDFLGWFASGATAAYDFTAEVVADLVLTAAWDASYTASFDKDAYTATGGGLMTMKATIVRADGATLTVADKDGWTVEYDSDRLESSGTPVWSLSKGMVTYKAKRNDAGFDTATGTVTLKRGDRVYDTATISVAPSATWTFTPSGTHMVESGAIALASLKVNGIAVDLADYTLASDDTTLATVAQSGSSATVTPVSAGKATFTLADGNGGELPLAVTFVDAAAKIGSTFYETVAKAMNAAASGDTVELCRDVTESVNFSGSTPRVDGFALTIDLAGHTWTGGTSNPYALRVDYGTITVKDTVGGGGVAYGTDYAFVVSHLAGAYTSKLVLESGAFSGKTSVAQVGMPGGSGSNKKYYGGTLEILGGTFEAVLDEGETLDADGHMRYLLNELDFSASAYPGGEYSPSEIVVKGGSFKQFDPANNVAEGADTSFLPAEGYVSVADDPSSGWYTVYEAVTVSFVNDKGAAPEAQVIGKGKKATEPADPAAVAGFRFDGWFAEGAEEAFDFDTAIAADLTLTAKWTPTTATVIWVVEGTQTEETYDIGATPVYPGATPTKAGTDSSVYVFTGWSPALGEVTAAGATYTAQFSLVSLSPASLELYPNCSNYVQVAGAPAGSTYTYKFAGQVGCDSYALNPPGWSKTEGWAWPYGKQPGGTGTITVTVTNDNAQIAVLTANVTVKDVAAVVDGVEYASAQFGDALNAAKTGDKVLEVYYYASGYAKVALGADESIRWKPADNRGKASLWTSAVTVPATTDTDWYKAIASKDAATGVTTVTCESQGVPYVKIDDGTTVTYSTSSFPTMNTAGATYTMLRDITRTSAIVASASDVVLDLNGYTLTLTKGSMNVKGGLTVKDDSEAGTGKIAKTTAAGTDTKLFLVNGGGTVAITGGAYESAGEILYTDETAGSAATISGGTFSSTAADTAFLLNCSDGNKGAIAVTGGSFQGFDPANNAADGADTDYVATGYVSVANDPSSGWFTVYEAVTVTFVDDKVTPPEAQVIGKGKTATKPEDPTFTGWTFEGWFAPEATEAFDFGTAIDADITLTAKWTQNEYDVIWVADGAQFASNRVAHGTAMPVPAENPTRAGDDDALYTFVKWTPAQDATVTSNATYTAEFKTWTKVAVPTAVENLVYTGSEQTGVAAGTGYTLSGVAVGTNAGDYTASASLADGENTVWADATEVNAAATAAKTIKWSIDKASVTVKANDAGKTYNESDPAVFTATVTGLIGSDTVAYTVSREAGEEVGTYTITPTGETEQGNYTVTYQTGTFTIDPIGTFTIIWLAEDGSTIESTTVEANTAPTHAAPDKTDATGKYAYAFAGWQDKATGTVYPDALPAATAAATYQATYTTSIKTPLALPLAVHSADATVTAPSATVALAPAGLLEGTTVTADPAAAYADGTFTFSDLAWNAKQTWSVSAAQGEGALAEEASNGGSFYAKARERWFTATTEDLVADGDWTGYAPENNPSAESEMVRVSTRVEMPAEGMTTAPQLAEGDKGAFTVLQLAGDAEAAYYAYDGQDWVKLAGAKPAGAVVDYLAVYDLAAAEPTVRYYIDGVALYHEEANGGKTYDIPVKSGTKNLTGIWFTGADAVKADIVAEQDVSYVAAIGTAPYTNVVEALDALAAADKAEANNVTIALLQGDLDPGAKTVTLSAGEAVTVDATGGSFAGDAPFVAAGAPAYKVVSAAGAAANTTVYSVELNEATVIWVAEDGTTELFKSNVVIGTVPIYLGEAQTKDATDAALYTWAGWTDAAGALYAGTLPAVAVGGTNYTATFKTWTKVARPTVANGLEYTGQEQTGVTVAAGSTATGVTAATAAGSYSATVSLDSADSVWADATDPADATARETITSSWSIARKAVTVTADNKSKIAGNADPELTATVTGLVNDEPENLISYTISRATGETAGTYAITASGTAEQGNYAVTFVPGTFTITGAEAMVISVADAETGATTTNYVATLAEAVASAQSGETVELLADVTLDARVEPNLGAGTSLTIDLGGHTITTTATCGNGSAFDVKSGNVTIRNGTIVGVEQLAVDEHGNEINETDAITARSGSNVTLADLDITVKSQNGACVYPFTGAHVTILSGNYANTTTVPYRWKTSWTGMAVNQGNVADTLVTIQGGTFSQVNPMLGDDSAAEGTMSFVNPDFFAVSEGGAFTVVPRIDIALATVTVADGLVYDATAKAGVDSVDYGTTNLVAGTDYVVTYANNVNAGEDTAVATIVGTNLWTGTITTNFSIAKAAATITVTAASKTYGADDPEFAGTVEGLVNEGDLGTVAYSRTGSDENVGTYDDVLTATYTANDNYTVTVVPADFTINAKTLTIVAEAKTQVYGAEAVALTYTSEGLEEGDEITGALTRAEGDDVGTYAISQGTLTAGDNYTIAFTGANYTITKAPVTITVANASKTYGDADPTFTGTVEGLVNAGDLGTIVYSRLNSDEDVGTYEAMLDAEYEANANYEVTLVRGDFTINAKAVTVTVAAKTKEYGDADPELTYEVAGLVNGDTLTGALTRAEGENVGTYAITQGTLAAGGNYTITFTGANLTITKATATVTAEAKSKTYGDADPELTATVTGLKGEDTAAVISYTLSRAEGENAGTYAITPAGDAEQGNYDVVYVPANLTIGAKTLTITVAAKTKEYGDADPELTYETDGLEDGDSLTGALTRAEGENVGTYAITQGTLAAGDNYTITFTGANLTITKATATVTAEAKSKTYGDADPELTATVTGLKGEDTAAVISYTLSRAEGENAGTYAITPAGDAEQGNYDVVYVPANLTIGAKTLTIVAEAKTQVYGAEAVALTYTSEGLEEGDEITGALTRAEGDDVGTYAISQGTLAAGDNYAIAFTGANYTITPATVQIPAAPGNKVYTSGVLTADVSSADTYTVVNEGGKDAGNYTVTFALADTTNYTWSDGSITNQVFGWSITKAPLTLTADDKTVAHGAAAPAYTYTPTGLLGSDTLATEPTLSCAYVAGDAVGTYPIAIADAVAPNYAITYANGTLNVTANPYTIIWVVDGKQTETEVEWGETPVFAGSTDKASDAKYDYTFSGWTDGEAQYAAGTDLPAVAGEATYTATYAKTIGTPLALAVADEKLASTAVVPVAKTATVAADLIGAVEGVQVAAQGATVAVAEGTATASFSGLEWNAPVDWTLSASQIAEDDAKTAESAELPGKFYVKPEKAWFTAAASELVAVADTSDAVVGYTPAAASPEGEMVRVHTKVNVPAGGLPQAPETGDSKTGFAVLQLDGDTAPAFYAFGNGTWTKLAGVEPEKGEADFYAVYDLGAETPTARYYVNGVALYAAGEGGAKVYALPLASGTTSLKSVSFASADMVAGDIAAEYDTSYVAAVDQTPYTEISEALEAAGKAGEKTLALLKAGVPLDPAVSLGTGEKLVVNYAKGTFTNDVPVVSGVTGYDVKVTEAETVKTYSLDPIVYPIEYVLGGGVNDASNTNEYTVADLPLALADASRTGYTFAGWTNNVSANAVATSIPVGTTGAVTNVATWTINNYLLTVNYLYTNGTVAATQFTSNVVYDTAYSVDSPVVQGYTADQLVVSGTMGAEPVTVDVTYRVNRYAVTFVDEDGTTLKAATDYDYGTLAADIAKPEDPTKAATADWVFTFAGWSPALADVTAEATYTATYTSNATVAAVITIADNGDGTATTNTAYVASLADAIAAANDGDTVQLLADVSEPAVALEDDITLDLNGNTWTVAGTGEPPVTNAVTIAGNVEIVDNSENGNGAISSAAGQVLVVDAADEEGATASVTIGEDATITATGNDATALAVVDGTATVEGDVTGDVTVAADGAVTVDGGTVTGDVASTGGDVTVADGSVTGGIAADDATVTVTGGTVGGGVAAEGDSTVVVSGGSVADGVTATDGADVTVSGTGSVAGGITSADGDVTVSGGSVTGDISSTGGEVAVSGGTVTGDIESTGGTVAVSGGEVTGGVAVFDGADATIEGGSVEGGVTATGAGSEVAITGGEIAGGVTVADGATGTISGDDTVVDGTLDGTTGTLTVTDGLFENDPSDYLEAGYVAIETANGYDVRQGKSVIGTTITVAGGTYNGQAYEIGSVVLGDYTLTASDYTVVYTNVIDGVATNDNVNAGTVTATITGIGEWIDTTNVTFAITKAPLTITADSITVPFRTPADAIEYTFSYDGFVTGETNTTALTTQPTASLDRTYDPVSARQGDTFTITPTGAVAANYEITVATGTLTVGPAEAPTILGTTSITVAQSTVTLQHVLQTGAKYYTYFTCTDLAKGEWVAAENSRVAATITPETVTDADGDEHEVATVTFTGVTDDVRFYQVGYSSVPYAFGDAMGLKAAEGGEQP